MTANRADFLESFSEEDLNYLVERWAMKVRFCRSGDMKWGIYHATRRPVKESGAESGPAVA